MKKVVYTVLLGDQYKLNEPTYITEEWEFICFTNQNINSDIWKIVKSRKGKKQSRKIKILSHYFFEYDLCLYLDSRFVVKRDLDELVDKYLKSDLCVMKHNKRSCAY